MIDEALECIYIRSRRFRTIRNGYTLALVSYAFALNKPTSSRSARAFRMLNRAQSRSKFLLSNVQDIRVLMSGFLSSFYFCL